MILCVGAAPAQSHSAARGFILLLPTGYMIFVGAMAVLATFCAISLLPHRLFHRNVGQSASPCPPPYEYHVTNFISALVLGVLIWIGSNGPRDPAENMLPLMVWTFWWVIVVLLHPIAGNLWDYLNPFAGLCRFVKLKGRVRYPELLSYWPAFLTFAAFAWFQLVYPSPDDPSLLAVAVSVYFLLTLLAIYVFGIAAWLGKGDPFAVFMFQLGACAPVNFHTKAKFRLPGAGLSLLAALPLSGVLFILLTLSSISFDGLAGTFFWAEATGVNPLDYPGRTAMVYANSIGLFGEFAVLAAIYSACVSIGWIWSGRPGTLEENLGRFIFSLIPISIAYHFSHYIGDTLINLQYLALALNDPFETGANLLGLAQFHVTASFQNSASGALAIFSAQCIAILIGHIVGVFVAHAIAGTIRTSEPNAVIRLEMPLAFFMVIYTAFSLWLLSTPSIS